MSTPDTGPDAGPQDELRQLRHALARTRAQLAHSQQALAEALCAAHRDALTGLPNRNAFGPLSERALATHQGSPRLLALLYVDLDGFKAVNDTLGHAAGDMLLRVVGARLSHGLRRGDLVCRHGGDEFICLLHNLSHVARAQAAAAQLVRAIAAPCQIGPHRVRVSASVGIALYPRNGRSIGALLDSADGAMYRAKAQRSGVAVAARACAGAQSPRDGPLRVRAAAVAGRCAASD